MGASVISVVPSAVVKEISGSSVHNNLARDEIIAFEK
jgi:hypothetical protein